MREPLHEVEETPYAVDTTGWQRLLEIEGQGGWRSGEGKTTGFDLCVEFFHGLGRHAVGCDGMGWDREDMAMREGICSVVVIAWGWVMWRCDGMCEALLTCDAGV